MKKKERKKQMVEIFDSEKVEILFSQNRKWMTTAKFLKTQSEIERKNTVRNIFEILVDLLLSRIWPVISWFDLMEPIKSNFVFTCFLFSLVRLSIYSEQKIYLLFTMV